MPDYRHVGVGVVGEPEAAITIDCIAASRSQWRQNLHHHLYIHLHLHLYLLLHFYLLLHLQPHLHQRLNQKLQSPLFALQLHDLSGAKTFTSTFTSALR
jgi:hypothetical protein